MLNNYNILTQNGWYYKIGDRCEINCEYNSILRSNLKIDIRPPKEKLN